MAERRTNTLDDRTAILLSAVVGAVAGGCLGYLLFTDEGRRLREDLEPKLADLLAEVNKARTVVTEAKTAIADVRPFGR
jgi:hypothetical protein